MASLVWGQGKLRANQPRSQPNDKYLAWMSCNWYCITIFLKCHCIQCKFTWCNQVVQQLIWKWHMNWLHVVCRTFIEIMVSFVHLYHITMVTVQWDLISQVSTQTVLQSSSNVTIVSCIYIHCLLQNIESYEYDNHCLFPLHYRNFNTNKYSTEISEV